MLDAILISKKGKTLAATDTTMEQLETLFNICFDLKRMGLKPWKLQYEQYEMPQRLSTNPIRLAVPVHTLTYYLFLLFQEDNLIDLTRVLYDDATEAASRIAVDMMLIACKLHVMELHSAFFSPKKWKVASRAETPQKSDVRETVKIYPEVDLAVKVVDPTTNEEVRVTGRADWGFGYSGRDGAAHGTFLVAMEAKRRDLFSTAERQLLTYLAILRELRIRAGKTNTVTQGFYTDGYRYCFMAIQADGEVESSVPYDVLNPEGGKTIFNFIVTILEAAMKSSPTVTPTKAAEQQEKEISNFTGEVWTKVYVPYLSSSQTESDGEDEKFVNMPPLGLEERFRTRKEQRFG